MMIFCITPNVHLSVIYWNQGFEKEPTGDCKLQKIVISDVSKISTKTGKKTKTGTEPKYLPLNEPGR